MTTPPKILIIDLTLELQYLRDLIVRFYPFYGEAEFKSTIYWIIDSICLKTDTCFMVTQTACKTIDEFIQPNKPISQEEYDRIAMNIVRAAEGVMAKLANSGAYLGEGVFPYTLDRITSDKCSIVLRLNENMLRPEVLDGSLFR